MLNTNEFPRSILAALDTLADLGKALKEQEIKKPNVCQKVFVKDREQIAKLPDSPNDKKSSSC